MDTGDLAHKISEEKKESTRGYFKDTFCKDYDFTLLMPWKPEWKWCLAENILRLKSVQVNAKKAAVVTELKPKRGLLQCTGPKERHPRNKTTKWSPQWVVLFPGCLYFGGWRGWRVWLHRSGSLDSSGSQRTLKNCKSRRKKYSRPIRHRSRQVLHCRKRLAWGMAYSSYHLYSGGIGASFQCSSEFKNPDMEMWR